MTDASKNTRPRDDALLLERRLKEESDFRNEQDIVLQRFGPARIAEFFLCVFCEGVISLQRDAEVESF